MVEGEDFTPPVRLLADLTLEEAVTPLGGSADSIASVVWHTLFWVDAWNLAITGDPNPLRGYRNDDTWPEVAAEEWPGLRDRLLASFETAERLAGTLSMEGPGRPEGHTVAQNLLQIAIHTAYHIGQIAQIRRNAGLWPPEGGE
jgi:uncharacterized damage-inducible protein DinB